MCFLNVSVMSGEKGLVWCSSGSVVSLCDSDLRGYVHIFFILRSCSLPLVHIVSGEYQLYCCMYNVYQCFMRLRGVQVYSLCDGGYATIRATQ
jgi:hypothetical protein